MQYVGVRVFYTRRWKREGALDVVFVVVFVVEWAHVQTGAHGPNARPLVRTCLWIWVGVDRGVLVSRWMGG